MSRTPRREGAAADLGRPAGGAPETVRRRCRRHPAVTATWRCDRCRGHLCDECVKHRVVHDHPIQVCVCGGRAHPHRYEGIEQHRQELKLGFRDALAWPWRGPGKFIVVIPGLAHALFGLLASVFPLFTLVHAPLCLLAAAYLAGTLEQVVRVTATAPDRSLDWHEGDTFGELFLVSSLRFAGALVLYLGPGLALEHGFSVSPWVFLPAQALGALFVPAALAAVSIRESLAALSPAFLLRSIARLRGDYLLALLWFYAILAATTALAGRLLHVPVLSPFLTASLAVYSLAVLMRLMGVLYRANEQRLAWL